MSSQKHGACIISKDAIFTIEEQTQQVLDELWTEKAIPFVLNVGKITSDSAEYTIHFYDSRIRQALVPMTNPQSFTHLVRSAVLELVERLSGPLKWTQAD